MKSLRVVILILAAGGLFAAFDFVSAKYFDSCGISESYAIEKVLAFLSPKDSAAESRLAYYHHRGTCEHSYSYSGPAGSFDLVVIDDPIHGPKLTVWDRARDKSP